MARQPASRKYQLTLNNPIEHDFTHERIKAILNSFTGIVYWCLCDEIGTEGTPHTHIYTVFANAVMFQTILQKFYGAHIEMAQGSHKQNRDYVRKEGKWAESDKKETNLPETFEESGDLPEDREENKKQSEAIYSMVKDGASNFEIMEQFPNAMNRLDKIDRARQELLSERYRKHFRNIDVTYIYGSTGIGKTRGVMEQYGYENIYRVTNYEHPFDTYGSQDVVIFEEFRSSRQISEMLVWLEGYPINLPCRYADKVACFTKVFLITNIPLEQQYTGIQMEQPETWNAFKRRIGKVIQMEQPLPEWAQNM